MGQGSNPSLGSFFLHVLVAASVGLISLSLIGRSVCFFVVLIVIKL